VGILRTYRRRKRRDRERWYEVIKLRREGRRLSRFVHALVLLAFVGSRPAGMETRHLDGDGLNNRLDNLRYGTSKENGEDMVRHGNSLKGTRNPAAKCDPATAGAVREAAAAGEAQHRIAARFKLSQTTVSRIVRGVRWAVPS
jgi:hypothetical protein